MRNFLIKIETVLTRWELRYFPRDRAYAFNPVTLVANLVISLALSALSYALSPKRSAPPPRAVSLDQFRIPRVREGDPWPVIDGTILITDPVVIGAPRSTFEAIPVRQSVGK